MKGGGEVGLPQLSSPAGRPPWPTSRDNNRLQRADHHTLYQRGKLLPSGARGPDPADLQVGDTKPFCRHFEIMKSLESVQKDMIGINTLFRWPTLLNGVLCSTICF